MSDMHADKLSLERMLESVRQLERDTQRVITSFGGANCSESSREEVGDERCHRTELDRVTIKYG